MTGHRVGLPLPQTNVTPTPADMAEKSDTTAAQLCEQLQGDGMTPALAARVVTWANAGGGYNRQEMIDRAAYFVRLIVERIATARRPRAQAEAFRIAFGFHRDAADSIRQAARRVHMSSPGLQKRVNAIRAELHLSKYNAFTGAGRSGAPRINGQQSFNVPRGTIQKSGQQSPKVLPKASVCR